MRKSLIFGLPVLAVVAAGGAWYVLHPRDPIGSAKQRMAHGDLRGAEQYLRQAVVRHPRSPEAAYLLGLADLGLGSPEAAELELKRARDYGYDPNAIILPLGQAYLQQQHFTAALADFDPAHATPAARPYVLTIRAAAQMALGDLADAKTTSDQAEAAAPKQRETLLTAARIAMARGDLDGAAARATRILAASPGEPEATLLRSEIAMRRNDPKSALAGAQSVLAATPGRLDARMIEARSLAALGKTDAARASLAQVLRAAPKNISANFLGAMLAVQVGDYPAADAMMTQISPVIGHLPHGYYFLAVTKLGMGQPAQAEEAITKFLVQMPNDVAGMKLLAFVELARRKPAAALDVLRQAPLATHPDADTLDLAGRAQAMEGDVQAAKGSFAEAFRLAPADTAILNRLAASKLSLGDVEAAETDLRHSLQLDPQQRLAGEAIVQAALSRGDFAEAGQQVERLRRAVGDGEEVGVLAAQVKIAALDFDGAEAQLRDVLRRFPDSRPATMNLVRIASLRGDHAAAEALLRDLLARHPEDQSALAVLMPALFADGHTDQAVALAQAAHAASPDDVSVTAALATAYVRAHEPDRAAALLDRSSGGANPQLDMLRARVLTVDHKPEAAEAAYRDIIGETPTNLRARAELAALLLSQKHDDDARLVLQDGLRQAPGNPALMGALVNVDLHQGGIRQALARVATLRQDPQNLPAANALAGDAWLAAGDERQAAAAYAAAFQAAPSGDLAVRAARELGQTGANDKALALLSSWVTTHPDDVPAEVLLGSLYINANRLDDAERHLDHVLSLRRTDTAALNNLAWVKQQQGKTAEALTLAKRAYYQAPLPEMADTLGWILAKSGDLQRALPLLAEAVGSQDPTSRAEGAYHYGYALNAAGRGGEARTQLQAACDAKADFPGKDDARKLLATLK
jgi:putative PEP-CTERM system TPR-repeat lipoprotein